MKGRIVIQDAIAISKAELFEMLEVASIVGRLEGEILAGARSITMPQSKAYELYRRGTVERWLNNGIVRRYIDYGEGTEKTAYRYNIIELLKAALKSNHIKNLPDKVKEEYRTALKL